MFTGLVEEIGIIRSVVKSHLSALLTIKADKVLDQLEEGDSIAVNGVCLTVTGFSRDNFTVDVMAETLAKTNLGLLHEGSQVNLERALKIGDRLDGHFVTGHVDATGTVLSRRDRGIATDIWISIPEGLEKYFIPQGSVTLDGVSLTVAELNSEAFMVSLIPHTQKITTLGSWKAGDKVNIEADVLGKYIYHLFTKRGRVEKERITPEFLVENGFF